MNIHELDWTAPETSNGDLVGFYALFLSIIRFALEKHGGTIQHDPAEGGILIGIPPRTEDECRKELWDLLGPGRPLNSFLMFLADTPLD